MQPGFLQLQLFLWTHLFVRVKWEEILNIKIVDGAKSGFKVLQAVASVSPWLEGRVDLLVQELQLLFYWIVSPPDGR